METAWDIWQFEDGWNLWPARVLLCCYAPLFPSETGEQLRIDFGSDSRFLPQPDLTGSLAPIRHNIRGLLHLVEDLDATLATDKRQLWSESEEDFAVRLESALSG